MPEKIDMEIFYHLHTHAWCHAMVQLTRCIAVTASANMHTKYTYKTRTYRIEAMSIRDLNEFMIYLCIHGMDCFSKLQISIAIRWGDQTSGADATVTEHKHTQKAQIPIYIRIWWGFYQLNEHEQQQIYSYFVNLVYLHFIHVTSLIRSF